MTAFLFLQLCTVNWDLTLWVVDAPGSNTVAIRMRWKWPLKSHDSVTFILNSLVLYHDFSYLFISHSFLLLLYRIKLWEENYRSILNVYRVFQQNVYLCLLRAWLVLPNNRKKQNNKKSLEGRKISLVHSLSSKWIPRFSPGFLYEFHKILIILEFIIHRGFSQRICMVLLSAS